MIKTMIGRRADFWENMFAGAQTVGNSILCHIVNFQGPKVSSPLLHTASANACRLNPILMSQLELVNEKKTEAANKVLYWKKRPVPSNGDSDSFLRFESVVPQRRQRDEEVNKNLALKICEEHITEPIQLHEPYVKVFHIDHGHESNTGVQQQFVILCPHTVVDGMSFPVLINDIFQQLEKLHGGRSDGCGVIEERQGVYFTDSQVQQLAGVDKEAPSSYPENIRLVPSDADEATIQSRKGKNAFVTGSLNDPVMLKKILAGCRSEGVSLHSLLAAAFSVGSSWTRQYPDDKFTICVTSAVSFRQQFADMYPSERESILRTMSNMHGASFDILEIENNKAKELDYNLLWKTARDHYQSLRQGIQSKRPIAILSDRHFPGHVPVTFYLSNVGRLDVISGNYGPFTIQSAPVFISSLESRSPFLTVNTIRDRLQFGVSFSEAVHKRETISRLIDECIAVLVDVANNEE